MHTPVGGGSLVVARYLDGRVIKGTTQDFAPHKPTFHLFPAGAATAAGTRGLSIPIADLKAVFFVKTHEGNRDHVEDLSFERARGQGRKVVVTFNDGEIVAGFTTAYAPDKQGWFLVPTDPGSNNSRVYVVSASVRKVEWADRPATVR